jgi:1,4-alpha-glucan branching enzyme
MTPPRTLSRFLAPDPADLHHLISGTHHDPHSILGAHEYGDHTVIRAFRPHAQEVAALIGGRRYPCSTSIPGCSRWRSRSSI